MKFSRCKNLGANFPFLSAVPSPLVTRIDAGDATPGGVARAGACACVCVYCVLCGAARRGWAPPRFEHQPAVVIGYVPRPSGRRPDVENPRPLQVRRLTASSEFVNIVQSAELLVAAAGHAGDLASSASVAFFEQAQEIQDCIDRLNIMAGGEQ